MIRNALLTLTTLLAIGITAAAQPRPAPQVNTPPIRGDVRIEMTEPVVKKTGKTIVTTFKVKNMEIGSIAGLRVDEFWYDKKGDPVTGSSFSYPKQLQPGEIIVVKLETPILDRSKMNRNQYVFKQANGNVKPTKVKKLS